MYETILLALDGSPLAEKAIPHAVAMAKKFDAQLMLLRVVSPAAAADGVTVAVPQLYDELIRAMEQAASGYVQSEARDLRDQQVKASGICRTGNPAAVILDVATEFKADVIVLTTHGRSGLGRWVFGSIAEKVLRAATVPILLVRASE